MDDLYLGDILHMISQGFLNPDKFVLVFLVLYTVFQCGMFLVELIGEHRHFKIVMPDFLNALDVATLEEIPDVIEHSGLLKKQKADVQAYLLDEAARVKVEAENADLAVIYNGEAYLAMENNEDLAFAVPEDGTCIWLDSFAIPVDAPNPAYAEKFLEFLCREEIAAMNFEYIYYSTPNQAVIDGLDEEIAANAAIFPADSIHDKASVLRYLGAEAEALYSQLWKNVKS